MRCHEKLGTATCEKPVCHEGFHQSGERTWGFRDTTPEWRKRAEELRRIYGRAAIKELQS